jgi:uncharacterized paraquat-inducible protein A
MKEQILKILNNCLRTTERPFVDFPSLPTINGKSEAAEKIEQLLRATIQMSEDNFYSRDEIYCKWYKCPSCKDTYVTKRDNYCGNCGVKLNWTEPKNVKKD